MIKPFLSDVTEVSWLAFLFTEEIVEVHAAYLMEREK